jgi:hypothetical protein
MSLLVFFAAPAKSALIEVDLELVLLIDVSSSVDSVESRLQRQGYVNAIIAPTVIAAIQKGRLGRIAITYIEWAGSKNQTVVAPWTIIEDFASAFAFSTLIEAAPRSHGNWTSIGGAINYAIPQFEMNNIDGERRAIDISADGPNNDGPAPNVARDSAVALGITINGLPIVNSRLQISGMKQMPNYAHYFADCVIGGGNAFLVIANDYEDFARAIKKKLIFEIAGRVPPSYRHNAQKSFILKAAQSTKPSCDAGFDYKRQDQSEKRQVY